jgi:hypothetical protein
MDHMRAMHTQGAELVDDMTRAQEENDTEDTVADDEV